MKYKKWRIEKIGWQRRESIEKRKLQMNQTILTAGQIKQEGALEKLIHLDEGYKFLRALHGSSPYFEKAKKDIFVMIRQLYGSLELP